MKNSFQLSFKTLALALLVLFQLPTGAFAQRGGGRDDRDRPGRDETITRRLDRNYRDRDYIDVMRLLGSRYDGREVRSITLTASADRRERASADLLVNGRAEDSVSIDSSRSQTLRTSGGKLGSDIRSLEIEFRGAVYVTSIDITVAEEKRQEPDRVCRVKNPYTRMTDTKEVKTWGECHDYTWVVGDQYCNDLRKGAPGPNPVHLQYSWGAASETWIFGCADVPERNR